MKLKPAAKILILLIAGGAGFGIYSAFIKKSGDTPKQAAKANDGEAGDTPTKSSDTEKKPDHSASKDVYRIALSEWPGHMAFIVGNGGLTTQPGSAAADLGIKLEFVFIEDPVKKNQALQQGTVDFVWQVVDEMPINMGSYKQAGVDAKAFLQIDWSRGGDACVATADVQSVEDIFTKNKNSAMMMFSPDHTVFEFMINNSRLTPAQIKTVRSNTKFSMDSFEFGRNLFTQGKVDVACLWEPDVTLALRGREGSHRLFSTSDATELVADVLLTTQDLIDKQPEVAEKVAKVWFAGAKAGNANKAAAAQLVSTVVPRFRDELKYEGTLKAFDWVLWTGVAENAKFFGLGGEQASFDRVYNQADGIWANYPEANIKDRFIPRNIRNASVVEKIWKAEGKVEQTETVVFEPKVAKTGKALFTKPVTINFDTGRSDLDAESMNILNGQVMPQLEMAGGMYVRVEGNSDNVGNAGMNVKLSAKRAKSVADFLVSKGIVADRISFKGNGDKNPVASNKTEDGRAQNRRTDILFISGAK